MGLFLGGWAYHTLIVERLRSWHAYRQWHRRLLRYPNLGESLLLRRISRNSGETWFQIIPWLILVWIMLLWKASSLRWNKRVCIATHSKPGQKQRIRLSISSTILSESKTSANHELSPMKKEHHFRCHKLYSKPYFACVHFFWARSLNRRPHLTKKTCLPTPSSLLLQ